MLETQVQHLKKELDTLSFLNSDLQQEKHSLISKVQDSNNVTSQLQKQLTQQKKTQIDVMADLEA